MCTGIAHGGELASELPVISHLIACKNLVRLSECVEEIMGT